MIKYEGGKKFFFPAEKNKHEEPKTDTNLELEFISE